MSPYGATAGPQGHSPDHHLAQLPDLLAPAKTLLDSLAPHLTHSITIMSCGARINGATALALVILCHTRRHEALAARLHKSPRVIRLVCPHRDAPAAPSTSSSMPMAVSRSACPSA